MTAHASRSATRKLVPSDRVWSTLYDSIVLLFVTSGIGSSECRVADATELHPNKEKLRGPPERAS